MRSGKTRVDRSNDVLSEPHKGYGVIVRDLSSDECFFVRQLAWAGSSDGPIVSVYELPPIDRQLGWERPILHPIGCHKKATGLIEDNILLRWYLWVHQKLKFNATKVAHAIKARP